MARASAIPHDDIGYRVTIQQLAQTITERAGSNDAADIYRERAVHDGYAAFAAARIDRQHYRHAALLSHRLSPYSI
jgi:hypothetical protein